MDFINGSETTLQNYKFKMLLEKPPHDFFYGFFFLSIVFKTNFIKAIIWCVVTLPVIGLEVSIRIRNNQQQRLSVQLSPK